MILLQLAAHQVSHWEVEVWGKSYLPTAAKAATCILRFAGISILYLPDLKVVCFAPHWLANLVTKLSLPGLPIFGVWPFGKAASSPGALPYPWKLTVDSSISCLTAVMQVPREFLRLLAHPKMKVSGSHTSQQVSPSAPKQLRNWQGWKYPNITECHDLYNIKCHGVSVLKKNASFS